MRIRGAWIAAAGAILVAVGISFVGENFMVGAEPRGISGGLEERGAITVSGQINAVSFGNTGQTLGVLSDFGSAIELFEVDNLKSIARFRRFGAGYSFSSFALLIDGNFITSTPTGEASSKLNSEADLKIDPKLARVDMFAAMRWKPVSGTVVNYYPAQSASDIHSANIFAVSEAETVLAAVNSNVVLLFDLNSGALTRRLPLAPPEHPDVATSLAFTSSGKLLVGTIRGEVIVFDVKTGRKERVFFAGPPDEYYVSALAASADGNIAVGRSPAFSGARIKGQWVQRQPSLIAVSVWSADGHLMAELAGQEYALGVADAAPVRALAWSPNSGRLAAGTGRGIEVWDRHGPSFAPILTRDLSGGSISLSFSSHDVLAVGSENRVLFFK